MTTTKDELRSEIQRLHQRLADGERTFMETWNRLKRRERQIFHVEALCDAEDARVARVNERLASEGMKSLKTGRPFQTVGILPVKRVRLALAGEQQAGHTDQQPETD